MCGAAATLLAATLLICAAPASAQLLDVGDPLLRYSRLLEVAGVPGGHWSNVGVVPLRLALEASASEGHPWRDHPRLAQPARDIDVSARILTYVNTSEPRSDNDGAVWQGKGLTTAASVRLDARWRGLSATLEPTVIGTQNLSFEVAPPIWAEAGPWGYPWRVIDLPQRFGPDAFWTFDLGQSELAAEWKGARLSVGTRNLWWGPALRNPIVMSNAGPGFPHVSLGTARPVDVGVGALEALWLWGRLAQSEWFEVAGLEDSRFLTGIVVSFEPDLLDGLSLGFTRVFQELMPDLPSLGSYFLVLQGLFKSGLISDERPDGTDERDQLLSFFARWVFPESGFEAYVEWARNDHSNSIRDFVLEPEHSSGITLGFQRTLGDEALWVIGGEATRLEATPTFQVRPRPTFYEHSVVRQGYTHRGQLLGAPIGPGGNAQSISVDRYAPSGSAMFFFERRVVDNDAFWVWAEREGISYGLHDVTLDWGVGGRYLRGDVEVGAHAILARELNRHFSGGDGWSFAVDLSARWFLR